MKSVILLDFAAYWNRDTFLYARLPCVSISDIVLVSNSSLKNIVLPSPFLLLRLFYNGSNHTNKGQLNEMPKVYIGKVCSTNYTLAQTTSIFAACATGIKNNCSGTCIQTALLSIDFKSPIVTIADICTAVGEPK